MTKALDPKLIKVIRLMRSTTHAGEKAAARARAEAMAATAGLTLDEAIAEVERPAPAFKNIFDGFDDYMERQEPGYKARRAAEQAARRRENAKKHAAVLAKYGSESPSGKGLSGRDRRDSRGLRDLIWKSHVDPDHPTTA